MSCSGDLAYSANMLLVLDPVFEKVEFAITDYNIPGFEIGLIIQSFSGAQIKTQGESIVFNPLQFSMILDKEFTTYEKIYNYLIDRVDPESTVFRPRQSKTQATIVINSNKKNPLAKFIYHDMIITGLGDIDLSKADSKTILKAPITAEYTWMEFKRIE